jgi:phosphoglycerate dehydrogenase-like enzyme
VECVFSTWGTPDLTQEQVAENLPNLKYLYYGAGSVQSFARPYMNNGVRIFSAWQANAVPVAEFTVAQVLLANKGYFSAMQLHSVGKRTDGVKAAESCPGNYGCRVGIIAAGQIGKMVIKALAARKLEVLVYDPYLPDEEAAALGAKKASLEEIFSTCQTVSNHLPNLPATQRMLTYEHFSRMRPGTTFINTGRGAQIEDEGLIRALQEDPTRMALIDVTLPEILPDDHIFYQLPNVLLTPHIAGSDGEEVARMGEYMLAECQAYLLGESCKYEVSIKMLETMA